MICAGSPPATRGSVGRPVMPKASCALGSPRAGGFLPADVRDTPRRNSRSWLEPGVQVTPEASCSFLT